MNRSWRDWISDLAAAIASGVELDQPSEGDYSIASRLSGRMGADEAEQYCRSQHGVAVGNERDRWRRIEIAVRRLAREENISHYWP